MEYPERLMGWVNLSEGSMEIRMKHCPNLFEENTYEIYDMHTVALPIRVMIGNPKGEYHGGRLYVIDYENLLNSPYITLGSQFSVKPNEDKWLGKLINTKVEILLKPIPKNIK